MDLLTSKRIEEENVSSKKVMNYSNDDSNEKYQISKHVEGIHF